jgi:hypothetical protein
MPLTDETPAPPIPTNFLADESDYAEILESLNKAGGYLNAATEDEDGNAIPESERVWVQSDGPTRTAIAPPDEAEVVEGEAIIKLDSRQAAKYSQTIDRLTSTGLLRPKTRDEIDAFRAAAIERAEAAKIAAEEAEREAELAAEEAEREAELAALEIEPVLP